MRSKVRVLFLESQPIISSDSRVHCLLMQSFDRREIEIHAACNPISEGTKSLSLCTLEAIADVHTLSAHFGPGTKMRSRMAMIKTIPSGLISLFRLALYVKRHHIDVIHAASRPRDATYAVVLSKLTGACALIHLHLAVSDWFGAPIRWALRNCDAILGISDFVSATALAAGYGAEKTFSVRNGIEPSLWDYTLDGTEVRQEFGIPASVPVLAIVSRLFYWKGHTELFKALGLVRQEVPEFRLLVVGEDDRSAHPGNGSYRKELESLAQKIGIAENVIFSGFRQDIDRILAAADIFTMPSYEEPLGLAFLEAMAMRRPVVALRSGGVPEVVEHGKSGLLSEPHDIEGLASNILTLIKNPCLRHSMGKYGRCSIEQTYNARRMATATTEVYGRVINASH